MSFLGGRTSARIDRSGTLGAVRKHRPDYQIVLYMGLLVLVGLVVLYAISPARVEFLNNNVSSELNQAYFMQKQLLYLAMGLVSFGIASVIPLTFWQKYTNKILVVAIALCALLALLGLFMNSGPIIKTGGAVRWFNLGISSFQPAELLKFGVMLFTAGFLGRRVRDGSISSIKDTLIPLGVVLAVAAFFIIVLQKDMGTGITLFGMVLAMLVAAGVSGRIFGVGLGVVAAAGLVLVMTSPHRIARVLTFLNPADVSDASSYHINQALIALGSGGLFGKGLGHSVQAFGYLPEAINDSIFAILGETFGFVGVIVILIIFYALLKRILRTMDRTVDVTARLMVAGIFGLLATHIVVNIGAMTGVFPLTGVTLPFLSFGGTSLLFTMIGLGVVFYISRYTTHKDLETKTEETSETTLRRRGIGRTRYTGARSRQRAE